MSNASPTAIEYLENARSSILAAAMVCHANNETKILGILNSLDTVLAAI